MRASAISAHIDLREHAAYALELGMRHLGTNGLLETVLFKEAVDFRLRALGARCGVRTRDVRTAQGQRLYGAVFYLELQTPPTLPLACFGENDTLRLVDHSRMAGRSILDGYVFFDCPEREAGKVPNDVAPGDLATAPFGWIRVAQRFVHDEHGVSQLRLAEPANIDRTKAGTWDEPSSASEAHRTMLQSRPETPPEFRVLDSRPFVTRLHVDPEHSVNGAGLFYFPAYVSLIDVAERGFLQNGIWPPCPDVLIGGRTTVRRTICYYGNAAWNDTVLVEVRVGVRDRTGDGDKITTGQTVAAQLHTVAHVYREADRNLIAIAECEKLLTVDRVSAASEGAVARLVGSHPRSLDPRHRPV